jgi:hypothetical protein
MTKIFMTKNVMTRLVMTKLVMTKLVLGKNMQIYAVTQCIESLQSSSIIAIQAKHGGYV